MKKLICLLILSMGFSGCATTVYHHEPIFYTTSGSTTGVIIDCSRNLGQEGVIGHSIRIDEEDSIRVQAVSQSTIYLDPGVHKIQFISIASLVKSTYSPFSTSSSSKGKIYQFGKANEIEIDIRENEIKKIKYTAPFLINQRGSLKVLD